jgi:RNA 3'-terminal phosphate cyclase-like protein
MQRCKGSQNFRQRLVLAALSGKALRIDDIRTSDLNPGLRNFEVCLLRLLEKISNGCVMEINETGTSIRYRPGIVTGGMGLEHDCGTARAIGYYVEPLICLAMFGKKVGANDHATFCGLVF